MAPFRLDGKTAVVTGAGSGIGNAVASLPGIFGNLSVEAFNGDYAGVFLFAG